MVLTLTPGSTSGTAGVAVTRTSRSAPATSAARSRRRSPPRSRRRVGEEARDHQEERQQVATAALPVASLIRGTAGAVPMPKTNRCAPPARSSSPPSRHSFSPPPPRARSARPTGLHGFLLRADEPATTTFHTTPSFAWSPVAGRDRLPVPALAEQHVPRQRRHLQRRHGPDPGRGAAAHTALDHRRPPLALRACARTRRRRHPAPGARRTASTSPPPPPPGPAPGSARRPPLDARRRRRPLRGVAHRHREPAGRS